MEKKEMLDVPEAAQKLGVSEAMVRKMVHNRLIAYHKVGDRVVFSLRDVDKFLRDNRVAPESEKAGVA